MLDNFVVVRTDLKLQGTGQAGQSMGRLGFPIKTLLELLMKD